MVNSDGLLPPTSELNIGALSRVFAETTTSYKYLFISALLTEFLDSNFSVYRFSFQQLAIGMLARAWYPVRIYLLSLGARDQIANILSHVSLDEIGPIPHHKMKVILAKQALDLSSIMRWVPYRTLGSFFAQELRGVPDSGKNARIRNLSTEHFLSSRTLYRFVSADMIELQPEWAAYIASNFPIISAWCERHWISYLQARNPTVPAISKKTSAPLRRTTLAAQTQYWKKLLWAGVEPVRCLYSGSALDASNFHLDHFLPWTFVCHDALWNLIPVSPEANAAKGNRLPHISYIHDFVLAQHKGLMLAERVLGAREWENASDQFIEDLRIPRAQILEYPILQEVYERSLAAQLALARGIGFEGDWRILA